MDIKLNQLPAKLASFLKRFHVVIFVVTVFGGLAVAVLVLSSILQASTSASTSVNTPAGLSTSFDKAVIERISELRTGDDAPRDMTLPAGRINPFSE